MVHRRPAAGLFILFEEGEFNDPEKLPPVTGDMSVFPGEIKAKGTEDLRHFPPVAAGKDKESAALLKSGYFYQVLLLPFVKELYEGSLESPVFQLESRKSPGTEFFRLFLHVGKILSR